MKTKTTDIANRKELERRYSQLLQKYDFYFISELSQLRNKNNYEILHLNEEDVYCVITGRSLNKTIKRKLM